MRANGVRPKGMEYVQWSPQVAANSRFLLVTDLADVWVHKWNIQSNPKVGQQDRRVAGSFQLVTTG